MSIGSPFDSPLSGIRSPLNRAGNVVASLALPVDWFLYTGKIADGIWYDDISFDGQLLLETIGTSDA